MSDPTPICMDIGDFRCGRCGVLMDGGTDEPVAAREYRKAIEEALDIMRRKDITNWERTNAAGLILAAALKGKESSRG